MNRRTRSAPRENLEDFSGHFRADINLPAENVTDGLHDLFAALVFHDVAASAGAKHAFCINRFVVHGDHEDREIRAQCLNVNSRPLFPVREISASTRSGAAGAIIEMACSAVSAHDRQMLGKDAQQLHDRRVLLARKHSRAEIRLLQFVAIRLNAPFGRQFGAALELRLAGLFENTWPVCR